MKALKNVKMKWKLFALCAPLIAVIIISVVMTGIKVSRTEKEVTAVYYDMLYTVNSNLLSADRDIYQTLNGATFYYDFHKLGSMYSGMTDEALSEYYEKKQSALDSVDEAARIAATDELLYTGIVSESGKNFQESYEAFKEAYERWDQQYDLEAEFGSWFHYQTTFAIAREHLDSMQQITNIWTDQKREEIRTQNRISIISYSVIYGVIIAALIAFVTLVLRQITSSISDVKTSLDSLAAGDLTHRFQDEEKMGQDELGSIQLSARNLSEKLRNIIGRTKEMSDMVTASGSELSESAQQATIASGQVCRAIEEISQGAIGQAESVEVASGNTNAIEQNITTIGSIIESLVVRTESMTKKCNETMATMRVLLDQNAEVIRDVQDIHDQISSTNNAVGSIAEASKIISAISSQTNLLSLNASIEAARAGESGRGFAVVATEIGNLADQSGNAAIRISKIVNNLVEESAKSVETIGKMNISFEKQNAHIGETETEVKAMEAEVNAIAGETERISEQVKNLMNAKDSLMNIITDLSAVSEENAASTQETNASMEELNATFNLISESADQLRQLASELNDNISFFTN